MGVGDRISFSMLSSKLLGVVVDVDDVLLGERKKSKSRVTGTAATLSIDALTLLDVPFIGDGTKVGVVLTGTGVADEEDQLCHRGGHIEFCKVKLKRLKPNSF